MRGWMSVVLVLVSGCVFQDSPEVPEASNNANNASPNNIVGENNIAVTPCEHFCDLYLGSCADNCSLPPAADGYRQDALALCLGLGDNSCQKQYETEPDFKALVDRVSKSTCDDSSIAKLRCETFGYDACGCETPDLLKDCASDLECPSTYLEGVCLGKTDARAGQCYYLSCSVGDTEDAAAVGDTTGCGLNNPCIQREPDASFCLQSCGPNNACRPGFGCRAQSVTEAVGYCDRLCASDSDCAGDEERTVCSNPGANPTRRFCAPACDTNSDCPDGVCIPNPEGNKYCDAGIGL